MRSVWPVCCSATHVAYCSLRMEPVYMMLGHASGDAAHLALAAKSPVQQVNALELRDLRGEALQHALVPKDLEAGQGCPHALRGTR